MNHQPLLSVVIPTRNRRKQLEKLLRVLDQQSASPALWEMIVVNNLSNDDTQVFLEDLSTTIPNLKALIEATPGSNYARNLGVKNAKSALIAFIDDDALPHPQWIERILSRYQHLNLDTDCLGGKVVLDFTAPLPRWYGPFLENYLSRIDLGGSFCRASARNLSSTNLIIPKKLLEEVGLFDLNMNRRTENLRSNDETLTLIKLERKGACFFFDPAVKVFHEIGPNRLTQSYFRRRAWWQGISDAEMETALSGKPQIWKEVIWPNLYSLLKQPSLLWLAFRPCWGPNKFSLAVQAQLFLGRVFGGAWALLRK